MQIKVLFLLNNLGGGGAERVLVNLVNNLDKTRYEITVKTIFVAGVNKENLSNDITLLESRIIEFKGVSRFIKLIPKRFFRNYIKGKYDVVIAYLHGAPTKILWNYSGKKIAWLHCDMKYSSLPLFFFKKQIKECFNTYNRIVGVSDSVSDSFKQLYGFDEKVCTLYNTNDTEFIKQQSNKEYYKEFAWNNYKGKKLITLGRLAEQKGFDRLINTCKRLKDDGYDFKLLILGKGGLESQLKKLMIDNQLDDTIEFGGFISNPYPYVKCADLFVCSSRYEGLSTVMSETLILGTPIISTDISGAREVLGDSEYGMVVENSEDGLYKGLKELLSNPEQIGYYKAKALERAPFFDTKNTVTAVENLIDEVINE